jgi:hypothetical protein
VLGDQNGIVKPIREGGTAMRKKVFLFLAGILAFFISFEISEGNAQPYTLTINEPGGGSGTVTSSPPGIKCPGDCSEAYNAGKRITLRAKAGSDSYFEGWSGGGCSGTKNCVVVMNENISVQATFQKKEPKLSVSPDTLIFEDVDPGKKATEVLTISNIGTMDLHITISLTGADLSYSGRSSFTLKPQKNYNLKVTYHKPTSDEGGMLFPEIDPDEMPLDQRVLGKIRISSEAGDADVPAIGIIPLANPTISILHQFIVDVEGGSSDFYMTITMGPAEGQIIPVTCTEYFCDVSGEYTADIVVTGMQTSGTSCKKTCPITGGGKLNGSIVSGISRLDLDTKVYQLYIEEKWNNFAITMQCTDCHGNVDNTEPLLLPFTPLEAFDITISEQSPVTLPLESGVSEIWGGWSWQLKY